MAKDREIEFATRHAQVMIDAHRKLREATDILPMATLPEAERKTLCDAIGIMHKKENEYFGRLQELKKRYQ